MAQGGWQRLAGESLLTVIMGFVETHSALLVPCRRVSVYTNGKYPPNILRENPENHVVSLNPSVCLACMALMPWPHLLLLGSWRSRVLSFTMLWPSCFSILLLEFHLLFSAWRPWYCPPPCPWPGMLSLPRTGSSSPEEAFLKHLTCRQHSLYPVHFQPIVLFVSLIAPTWNWFHDLKLLT